MACRAVLHRLPLRSPFPAVPASFPSSISYQSCHPPRAFRFRVCGINSEAKLEAVTQSKEDSHSSKMWKIKMLYDGECPLCMREVNMLRERNKPYGAIKFVDISSNDYSPQENQGLDYKTLAAIKVTGRWPDYKDQYKVMGRIHAILSDGTVVRDVEAFRRLYEEVGLGWVYAITKYEPIATIASAIYGAWAKYRMQITGRPSLEDILELRKKNTDEVCSGDKVCKK